MKATMRKGLRAEARRIAALPTEAAMETALAGHLRDLTTNHHHEGATMTNPTADQIIRRAASDQVAYLRRTANECRRRFPDHARAAELEAQAAEISRALHETKDRSDLLSEAQPKLDAMGVAIATAAACWPVRQTSRTPRRSR